MDAIISYFNIYEFQGETFHAEKRIGCLLDFKFYKKLCKYNYLKCSSYRPWIETAPHYIESSHNKLSENYILYLNSLRDGGEIRSQLKFVRFGLASEELLLGKLLPLMPNISHQMNCKEQPIETSNIKMKLIPDMNWSMGQWTATSARSCLGVGSIRVMLNFLILAFLTSSVAASPPPHSFIINNFV
jgi:hypothetical protein